PFWGMIGKVLWGPAMARCANSSYQPKQTILFAFEACLGARTPAWLWRNSLFFLHAFATVLLETLLAFFWQQRYQRTHTKHLDTKKRKEKMGEMGHKAAGVAHENRKPLSSIKWLAKYFSERTPAG
ncbi:sensor protein ZraS, partial [Salmonella enterica subsp. enterica serovar Kentucky]